SERRALTFQSSCKNAPRSLVRLERSKTPEPMSETPLPIRKSLKLAKLIWPRGKGVEKEVELRVSVLATHSQAMTAGEDRQRVADCKSVNPRRLIRER